MHVEERRFFRRTGYDGQVRCNVIHDGASFDAITTSCDISGGGIRLSSHEKLESPQNIALELFVPGYRRPIPIKGEVIWARTDSAEEDVSAGVRFTKIDSYDRQMILDYVHFS
jgi:c-di-GMP-binding flagellar brake protein YcgR